MNATKSAAKKPTAKQIAAALKLATWGAYLEIMGAAERSAESLADTIERYLKSSQGFDAFNALYAAFVAYQFARAAAEPYHFGTITEYTSSDAANARPLELLAIVRNLRGTAVNATVEVGDRKVAGFQYADDGIAGFYRVEVRSMAKFGAPPPLVRRMGSLRGCAQACRRGGVRATGCDLGTRSGGRGAGGKRRGVTVLRVTP